MNTPSKTKIWGTPMWTFIHTFTIKINEVFFIHNRAKIINILKILFECIPCEHCKSHAMKYIKRNDMVQITNKQQCIDYFVDFHNVVNKNLGKLLFNFDVYDIYQKLDTWNITVNMYNMVVSRRTSSKHMLDAIYRKERMMSVIDFVKHNIDYLI